MYDTNSKTSGNVYPSSSTLYSPRVQRNLNSTKITKNNSFYKSEGNMRKDETIVNGICSENGSINNSTDSLHQKNYTSEYIEPMMMKQKSVDSLIYKNNMLLRSKTLPTKANDKVRKNLLREYRHDIRKEEEEERRRKLDNECNFSSDDGWLSGPAGMQMFSDNNINNVQPNVYYSPSVRGRTMQISNHYGRHSMSLPPREKEGIFDKMKNKKRAKAISHDKDPNKDCIIS